MSLPQSLPEGKWRWIVVNSSGGKDSQTALAETIRVADAAGFPRANIVVSHQDLGHVEWHGAKEVADAQARHYGVRFLISRYRNKHGEELTLLDYARKRGKWPDNANRWCTSEFKRAAGGRIITQLYREQAGDILQVFGFRAEESPARKKKPVLSVNLRLTTKSRIVKDWLPIHDWTTEQVWNDIHASGVQHHYAYDLGMSRLSCCFCVFAPKRALMIAGKANPELLRNYIDVETEIGHDFQHNKPLRLIREAIEAGEEPAGEDTGTWNM